MRIGLLILLLHFGGLVSAQKTITTSNQQFFQYYSTIKLSPKWSILSDAGFRTIDGFSEKSQWIVRAGLGYQVGSNVRFGAGFANLGFFAGDSLSRLEYRPFQEMFVKHRLNKIGSSHRFRVEQRFFSGLAEPKTSSFNFRFRYQFSLNFPLWTSKDNPNRKLMLSVADELFINAGKDVVYNIFQQNRFLVGPIFKVNKNFALQLVYNHQFVGKNAPAEYGQDYVFWFRIKHTIPVFKKSSPSDKSSGGKGDGSGSGDGTGGGRQR